MRYDSVIIGGGLSGLLCGLRLAQAGKHCAIISSGQSALHFSSGSFDLLSALPNGEAVTSPMEGVKSLAAQEAEHPYVKMGVERFGTLAAEAVATLNAAGVAVEGDAAKNHYRLTPMGTLKPTWLTMAGYVRSDSAEALPYKSVLLLNAEGFLDFYTQFVSDELRKMGTSCRVYNFNLPALEIIRNNPTEMRSANIARIFDKQESVDALAEIILREKGDCEAVLLPAFLGVEHTDVLARLREQCGCTICTVATLPPSVPGLRTQKRLRQAFEQAGGVYMLGDTAVKYEAENGRITKLYTHNHGNIAIEADNFVLATGSYFSRGLISDRDGIVEPLFGADVYQSESRGEWYDRDLFAVQPFEKFGVKTDASLHVLRNGEAVENLYAIGAGLAGFNPVKEGCGAGVSMLTAVYVSDNILKK